MQKHMDQENIAKLTKLMRAEKDGNMLRRLQVILLFLQSYVVADIVAITAVSKTSVYEWINIFEESGIEGLGYKGHPGAVPKLNDVQKQELKQTILENKPKDVGYPSKNRWTLKIIVDYVKKTFNETYTLPGMSYVLKDLGLSWTKATYRLAKADEEKQREFIEVTMSELKEKLENGELSAILFEDEATIRDYQALGYDWFLKGEQKVIPTYGRHGSVKYGAVLDWATGNLITLESDKFNGASFVELLTNALKEYPDGKVAVVVDGSTTHKSKVVKEFLAANSERLELIFLPPYSPNLNLVEGLWK